MTREEAVSRHEAAAIRDIPQSCACGDWQYQKRPPRWVLGRVRCGCPWHLSREHVPMPRYAPTVIYACPECHGDLEHEGVDGYWCRACRRAYSFTQVAPYDETDYDRD